MRWLVVAVAVLLYAAAFAVVGAGLRLPEAAAPTLVPSAAPAPRAAPRGDDEQVRAAMQELAREQAANRELVAELRSTVRELESRLAAGAGGRTAPGPPGRTVAILSGLLFAPEQAALTPEARAAVLALLPELMSRPDAIVSVEGHADSLPLRRSGGAHQDNVELSLQRARAVAAVLVGAGLPERNVRVKGWGDSRPQAGNDTEAGRALNRRVEIRLVAGNGPR